MRRLSDAKVGILRAMRGRGRMTPTEIGVACHKLRVDASSWACRHLKGLVAMGLVSRRRLQLTYLRGVQYRITAKGVLALGAAAGGGGA